MPKLRNSNSHNLNYERERKMLVKFNGASDAQANWGRGRDPRKYLKIGEIYEITKTEGHTWHTLYYIDVNGESILFNSVCFSPQE